MPPYGIDSLLNRDFDTQGYFTTPVESIYDPAFGKLNFNRAYGPAPFTGNIPLTSYRVEPAYKYVSDVDGKINSLGFEGDIDLPSFGGASNPRYDQFGKDIDFINAPQDIYPAAVPPDFINAPQNYYSTDGITNLYGNADDVFPFAPKNRLGGLDLNRFEGIGSLGVANEEDVEDVEQGQKKSGGIADLFKAILGFAIPGVNFFLDKGRNVLGGIQSLNQRLRNTDFGRSKNLMDFLDMKKYGGYEGREDARAATMAQARGIQKKIDAGDYGTRDISIDRGRGSIPSRSSPTTSKRDTSPSSSYSQASYARRR